MKTLSPWTGKTHIPRTCLFLVKPADRSHVLRPSQMTPAQRRPPLRRPGSWTRLMPGPPGATPIQKSRGSASRLPDQTSSQSPACRGSPALQAQESLPLPVSALDRGLPHRLRVEEGVAGTPPPPPPPSAPGHWVIARSPFLPWIVQRVWSWQTLLSPELPGAGCLPVTLRGTSSTPWLAAQLTATCDRDIEWE